MVRKKHNTTIDTSVWVTQEALANEVGVKVQCVNNWIRRGKIEFKPIPGSRLVLVNKLTAPKVGVRFTKKQP